MSDRLPRVTAKEIIAVLQRRGFVHKRTSGSHYIFKNVEGRRVTVPVHSEKILHPKVLLSILHDSEMTSEELKSEL